MNAVRACTSAFTSAFTSAVTRTFTSAVTITVIAALSLGTLATSCGDDGNDQAFQARRAAELAAEFRSSQTTTVAPEPESTADEASITAIPSTTPTPPTPEQPAVEPTGVVVPVVALDNTFRPALIEIAVGDEVLWENRGLNEHNLLRVEGEGWGVEVDAFQPGDIYAHVFTEPGEYRYYCSIHGNEDVGMTGTVIVSG